MELYMSKSNAKTKSKKPKDEANAQDLLDWIASGQYTFFLELKGWKMINILVK